VERRSIRPVVAASTTISGVGDDDAGRGTGEVFVQRTIHV